LLPYVDLDPAAFRAAARQINPGVEILALSATTGDGVDSWYRHLSDMRG
jgi:hydrogenase nickel incorporation protein HypB